MSGIVAVHGCPRHDALVVGKTAMQAMHYRSRDGQAHWCDDQTFLGINYTRALPEDPEHPAVVTNDGVYVVAHLRLDNRSELQATLDLVPTMSDSEILLQAYLRWGTQCAEHLLGDFAAVVWDRPRARLLALRDHLGVKPLFFRFDDRGGLLIASDAAPLVSPGGPFIDARNEGVLDAQLIDFVIGRPSESTKVGFAAIERLPAGCRLIAEAGRAFRIERYWTPGLGSVLEVDDPSRLRELLTAAVKCRQRSIRAPVAMLSGGLDSTSICVIAESLLAQGSQDRVATVSAVFDSDRRHNERPFIEAALKGRRFRPLIIDLSAYNPLAFLDRLIEASGRVFNAPGIGMSQRIFEAVRSNGYDVILHGHGGDEVISHGLGRLPGLAQSRRWLTLWRETAGFSGLYGQSRLLVFLLYATRYGGFRGAYRLNRVIARMSRVGAKDGPVMPLAPALKTLAPTRVVEPAEDERTHHLRILQSVATAENFETLDVAAALSGVEVRFPFYDKRIVEYCLRLSPEARLHKGWTRWILRKAMDGLLPPEVQWRRTKFDFTPHLAKGLALQGPDAIRRLRSERENTLEALIDLTQVDEIYQEIRRAPEKAPSPKVGAVWRTLFLSRWLHAFGPQRGEDVPRAP